MTGQKNRALQVPYIVPYKALGNFSKALYGTTGGTCSARFFRPVMTYMGITVHTMLKATLQKICAWPWKC